MSRLTTKVNDQYRLAIPKAILDLLGIEKGDAVSIAVVKNKIVIEKSEKSD